METGVIRKHLFEHRDRGPHEHFKLYFYAALLDLIEYVSLVYGSHEKALAQFRFLESYENELAQCGLESCTLSDGAGWWMESLKQWEASGKTFLPFLAIAGSAGLDYASILTLVTIGLVEEDARFGAVFEALEGAPGNRRPTLGMLTAWRQASTIRGDVRPLLRRLIDFGLVAAVNPEAPRADWMLQVPPPIWDSLCGERHAEPARGFLYRPSDTELSLEDLVLSKDLRIVLEAIPQLMEGREARALIIRGPQRNGRRSVARAIARSLGLGTLEAGAPAISDPEKRQLVGPLTTLLNAMPVFVFDLAPGEVAAVPPLAGYDGPHAVVLGRNGGVEGAAVDRAITVHLGIPDTAVREQLWSRALSGNTAEPLSDIARRFRLTAGNIQRAGRLSASYASVGARPVVELCDVRQASRALNRQALDTLAARVETEGDWTSLAAGAHTLDELHNLESRCRHRETVSASSGLAFSGQRNAGVRAMFSGPSGTGKTLAARLLASRLQMDLYRMDLSTVVNKYIGETEKNLSRIFSRAEELDVILLLDEGDALLTQRTSVLTSNDRYANLETNYLLQRFETFEGIVIVTTNGAERIDSAFQRRMDVVVEFRPPEASERWAIWQLHLPADHEVSSDLLREIAVRCNMTGGQIRNAVVQATLLSLEENGAIRPEHLEAAVHREYRKAGAMCPLRSAPRLRAAR